MARVAKITELTLAVFVLAAGSLSADCLTWLGNIFDTTRSCAGTPSIARAIGLGEMEWDSHDYLVANIGNELKWWDVDVPIAPVVGTGSSFNVGNAGDSDYDLLNFSVCDDCRYGIANYKKASVLFDLGTLPYPKMSSAEINWAAGYAGGFTFSRGNQQYLITNKYPDACTGGSTLYLFDGVEAADLTKIGCVAGWNVARGIDYANHLYLLNGSNPASVGIFAVSGTGAGLTLTFLGSSMVGYAGQGHGFRIDSEHDSATGSDSQNTYIYDLSVPDQPVVIATIPKPEIQWNNRNALASPMLFYGTESADRGYVADVSDPGAVAADVDPMFWDASHPWNDGGGCPYIRDAIFAQDRTTMYLARFSTLQIISVVYCLPPDPQPGLIFADGFEDGDLRRWQFLEAMPDG